MLSARQLAKPVALLSHPRNQFFLGQSREHPQGTDPPQRKCLSLRYRKIKNCERQ